MIKGPQCGYRACPHHLRGFYSIAMRQWITPQVLELDAEDCPDLIVVREQPETLGGYRSG